MAAERKHDPEYDPTTDYGAYETEASEADDATAAESPLTAAVVTVTIERLLTQELDASCEMATEITQQILAIVECALPIPEGPPFDSNCSKIMYAGARLGAVVRQRGISDDPPPNEVTAVACTYFLEDLKCALDRGVLAADQLDAARAQLTTNRGELAAARAELAEKTATLRAVDREASARHVDAKVAEARETERGAAAAESASLRATCAQLRSENEGLRAGKKKLREALDRAKEKR